MGIYKKSSFRYIVAPSSNDKHAKNAVVGQYLQGTMTLAKVRYFNLVLEWAYFTFQFLIYVYLESFN